LVRRFRAAAKRAASFRVFLFVARRWATRFFVVMLMHLERVDGQMLHSASDKIISRRN